MIVIVKGSACSIYYAEDVKTGESWNEAFERLHPKKLRSRIQARMKGRLKMLSNGQTKAFVKDFKAEGKLPAPKNGRFYAIRADTIRAYGWYSDRYNKCFIISHFKYKDYQKLDSRDTDRVHRCWKKIEVEDK